MFFGNNISNGSKESKEINKEINKINRDNLLKPNESDNTILVNEVPTSNNDINNSNFQLKKNSWLRAAMFIISVIIILYLQSISRDKDNVSEDDLGLIYTLYTFSLLLLVGMPVLWQL